MRGERIICDHCGKTIDPVLRLTIAIESPDQSAHLVIEQYTNGIWNSHNVGRTLDFCDSQHLYNYFSDKKI